MTGAAKRAVPSVAALLADVDGTVVTREKVITERAIQAVRRMRERGLIFTITSGRPPRGLRMLAEPLGLTMPMAAFRTPAEVLTAALYERFGSRGEAEFQNKLLSAMRFQFGGHHEKPSQ